MRTIGTAKENARLAELRSYHILDTLPEEEYDFITQLSAQICDTPIALISLIDQSRQWFKSHYGIDFSETPRSYSFCAHAIQSDEEVFVIPDSRKDARFKDNPLVTSNPYFIFYLGIPLLSQEGTPIGTLCVIDQKPRELSDQQISTLKGLAKQLLKLLELRKNQTRLHLIEERYKVLLDHSIDAIYILEEDGTILDVNNPACEMLGFSREERINTNITDRDIRNTKLDFIRYWSRYNGYHTKLFETVHRHKDGTLIPVEINGISFIQEGKKFIYCICRDLTERKRSKTRLKESEEKFRLLFENMNTAFAMNKVITNQQGEVIDYVFEEVNPFFERLLGIKKEEIIDKRVLEVYPNTEKYWIEKFGAVALSGKSLEYINYFQETNRYYETKVYCPKPGYFAVTFTDISEKEKAEKTLREAEKRYRTFINSVREGVYRFDLKKPMDINLSLEEQVDHLYKYAFMEECNEEFLKMYNLSKEKVIGRQLADFLSADPLPKNIAIIQRFILTGYRISQEITVESNVDGEIKYYSNDIFGIIDEDNQLIRIWGTQTDITKLKTFEKELIEAKEFAEEKERELKDKNEKIVLQNQVYVATNEELAESYSKISEINEELHKANQELDNFVYRVSHDLRSPVASCLALIDLALQEDDPLQVRELLNMQEKSLLKQDKFIRDILDYSRNTRKAIEPVEVDLRQMIDEIVSSLSHDYRNTQCSFVLHGDEKLVCDSMRLQMILNNLISNAFKYSIFNDNPIVQIEATIKTEAVLIHIRDNGIGIPEKDQKMVFQMFYRATTRSNGSGLGLYIVKEAIEKMQGKIKLASKVGEGTNISIQLPNLAKYDLKAAKV